MFVAALSGYDQCLVEDKTAVCHARMSQLVREDANMQLSLEPNAGSATSL